MIKSRHLCFARLATFSLASTTSFLYDDRGTVCSSFSHADSLRTASTSCFPRRFLFPARCCPSFLAFHTSCLRCFPFRRSRHSGSCSCTHNWWRRCNDVSFFLQFTPWWWLVTPFGYHGTSTSSTIHSLEVCKSLKEIYITFRLSRGCALGRNWLRPQRWTARCPQQR